MPDVETEERKRDIYVSLPVSAKIIASSDNDDFSFRVVEEEYITCRLDDHVMELICLASGITYDTFWEKILKEEEA